MPSVFISHRWAHAQDYYQEGQIEVRTRINDIVTRDAFVELLKKSLLILAPIDKIIVMYQYYSFPSSEVLVDFTITLTSAGNGLKTEEVIRGEEFERLPLSTVISIDRDREKEKSLEARAEKMAKFLRSVLNDAADAESVTST